MKTSRNLVDSFSVVTTRQCLLHFLLLIPNVTRRVTQTEHNFTKYCSGIITVVTRPDTRQGSFSEDLISENASLPPSYTPLPAWSPPPVHFKLSRQKTFMGGLQEQVWWLSPFIGPSNLSAVFWSAAVQSVQDNDVLSGSAAAARSQDRVICLQHEARSCLISAGIRI